MKIMIDWNGDCYEAIILDDFKVVLEFSRRNIELNQCKECGMWFSEDEELYGDGYCSECAAMCIHCESYFNAVDMIPPKKDGEEHICIECHRKEAKKLWDELADVHIDDEECIDIDWKDFDKGTSIEYIWHWFEEEFDYQWLKI